MMQTEVRFTTTTYDGYPIVFIWNGSATIRVCTGIQEDGEICDLVDIDVFTSYGKDGNGMSFTEARLLCEEYMQEHYPIAS